MITLLFGINDVIWWPFCFQNKDTTRKMFLLTKTKHPKKVHCNIIYSGKRFLKIKTCSERSEEKREEVKVKQTVWKFMH